MTLQDIIDATRYRLSNFEKPYLWLDSELVFYANKAIDVICRDGKILEDAATASVCQFSTVVGQYDYLLSPLIIYIKSVGFVDSNSNTVFLQKYTTEEMDKYCRGWRTQDNAQPTRYILDYTKGYITFYAPPDAIYTIKMSVIRYPLVQLSSASMTQTIEIDSVWDSVILDGICYQAFRKRGDNTYSKEASDTYYAQFRKGILDMKKQNNLYESNAQTSGPVGGFI